MSKPLFADVIVNGEVIAHTAIAAETQNHSGPRGKPGIVWRKAANALVIRALLLQEAARRQITADPAELAPGRVETPHEATIRALLDDAIEVSRPTEAELRAIYDADPTRFRAPPLWEVSHILCACDAKDPASSDAAQRRAVALTQAAQANPARFAQLASEQSDCGSKSNGGALGQVGPGDTNPEFQVAITGLSVGGITGTPVRTRHGFHVIRLDAAIAGRVLPFETIRERLSDALEQRGWAKAAKDLTDQLVAKAEITGTVLGSF
jgi:peptidyl-prolyl cis-trans isomerase C